MKAMKSGSKVMTKGALIKTLAEQHEMKTKVCAGLLESLATLHDGGEEDRHFHNPRPLQDQDSRQTCHQGRSEDGIRSGGQVQGEASKDHREGLPSRCAQGSDPPFSKQRNSVVVDVGGH